MQWRPTRESCLYEDNGEFCNASDFILGNTVRMQAGDLMFKINIEFRYFGP
jgi:hypothetical protein